MELDSQAELCFPGLLAKAGDMQRREVVCRDYHRPVWRRPPYWRLIVALGFLLFVISLPGLIDKVGVNCIDVGLAQDV